MMFPFATVKFGREKGWRKSRDLFNNGDIEFAFSNAPKFFDWLVNATEIDGKI